MDRDKIRRMAAKPSLTFKLEGADKDAGAVFFEDFRQFLDDVAACLDRVQRRVTDQKVRHRIVDLKTASATVTIEALTRNGDQRAAHQIYDTFTRTIAALETSGKVDPRLKADDLKAFRRLAEPVLRGEKQVEVAGTTLSTRFVANIDEKLGKIVHSKGTVKGRLEKLNLHGRSEFTLYPPIGRHAVTCVFPEALFQTVRRAIQHSVTVSGLLTYRGDSPYPERVRVDSIEIHPSDDELPTLSSLRGLLPDATSGKTSVKFVEAIRDD